MIVVPFYISLSIFVICCLAHLFFCIKGDKRKQDLTKVQCIFMLGVAMIFFAPDKPLIYIGCFLGCIGDFFMEKTDDNVFLLCGVIFFALAQSTFLFIIISHLDSLSVTYWYVFLVTFIVYVTFVILMNILAKNLILPFRFAFPLYYGILLTNFVLGILVAIYGNTTAGLLLSIGYFIFIISDLVVAYTVVKEHNKWTPFIVMFTYFVAFTMIVFSFTMII